MSIPSKLFIMKSSSDSSLSTFQLYKEIEICPKVTRNIQIEKSDTASDNYGTFIFLWSLVFFKLKQFLGKYAPIYNSGKCLWGLFRTDSTSGFCALQSSQRQEKRDIYCGYGEDFSVNFITLISRIQLSYKGNACIGSGWLYLVVYA